MVYVKRAKIRSLIDKGKLTKTYNALRTERTFESNLYMTSSAKRCFMEGQQLHNLNRCRS